MGKCIYLSMDKKEQNPFVIDHDLNLLRVIENQYLGKKGAFDEDGDITDYAKITTVVATRFVERDRKITLYKVENIKTLIASLTPIATKLYLYVVFSLTEGCDYIELQPMSLYKELKVSKNTLYKAIEELETYSIIAKKRNGEFWINPFLFFNGNRIDYFQKQYPDNVHIAATLKR